ncbi:MAG: integrase core domain-containing protein [Anaerolineae bacterium]|nr:integrase core domain-containing protein [Anaerolineae bacterium]
MIELIIRPWKLLIGRVKLHIKQWTKPVTTGLVAGILSDATGSRLDLIAENALLRQQLIVLRRQVKRPQLTPGDRVRLVLLARCTQFWQQALHIVQPDTLLRWHRDLFRRYWRRRSREKKRKSRIPLETIELIRQMAKDNLLWGAERIRGELLKLIIKVSKRTIQKYMPKVRRPSGQTWATFLKNHASDVWACDFTVAHDLLFRALYIFVIIELETRRIVHAAVTRSPGDLWVAQQLREATPWGEGPKHLIRDRDTKYGEQFTSVARSTGIQQLRTPYQAPKANAVCERCIGSVRRECLDYTLILHENHLGRVVREYADYYNRSRPHQGIGQRIPARYGETNPAQSGRSIATPVLGGLHHSYSRVACPD